MSNEGKISRILKVVRLGLISDVPPEYQACESCREQFCDSAKAANCDDRILAERQERRRRLDEMKNIA